MANNCINRLNKVLQTLDEKNITNIAYQSFVKNTPIGKPSTWKSKPPKNYTPGNAKRNTKKSGNMIDADYPYAQRLEEGYSKQAPQGMTEPTLIEVRAYVFKTLGIRI